MTTFGITKTPGIDVDQKGDSTSKRQRRLRSDGGRSDQPGVLSPLSSAVALPLRVLGALRLHKGPQVLCVATSYYRCVVLASLTWRPGGCTLGPPCPMPGRMWTSGRPARTPGHVRTPCKCSGYIRTGGSRNPLRIGLRTYPLETCFSCLGEGESFHGTSSRYKVPSQGTYAIRTAKCQNDRSSRDTF